MYLLSKIELEELNRASQPLISKFSEEHAGDSHYYFRFGGTTADFVGRRAPITNDVLSLPPAEVIQVHVLESVVLPWNVLALLGTPTSLIRSGVQLLHGPSIDPGYSGAIELGVLNVTKEPLKLSLGEPILKALFFDLTSVRESAHIPEIVRRRLDFEQSDFSL